MYEVLSELERDGYIAKTRVIDASRLYTKWQDWYVKPLVRDYMLRNPPDILKRTNLVYALTTYMGENLVQNYLFPSRFDFYIRNNELDAWHKLLSQEGLVGRGNTRVLIGEPQALYNSSLHDGLNVVSIPQLIIDLLQEGGVCTEAAEMLISKGRTDVLQQV